MHKLIALAAAGFLAACTGAHAKECPAASHFVGTTKKGTVTTIHCKCNDGYELQDNVCVAATPWWQKAKNCGECGSYLRSALGKGQRRVARVTPQALYEHYDQSQRYYENCNKRFSDQCSKIDPSGYSVYDMTKACDQWNPAQAKNPEAAADGLEACLAPWAE